MTASRRALLALLVLASAGATLIAVLSFDRGAQDALRPSPRAEEPAPPRRAEAESPRSTQRTDGVGAPATKSSRPAKETFVLRVIFVDAEGRRLANAGTERLALRAIVGADPPGERMPLWLQAGYRGLPSRGERRAPDAECDEILELHDPPPWNVSAVAGHRVLATVRVGAPGEVKIAVDPIDICAPAELKVRVVDESTGKPAEDASLFVSTRAGGFEPVGLDGGAATIPLEPGTYALAARCEGLASRVENVSLRAGENRTLVLALQTDAAIRGRLVGADGKGMSGNVQARLADPYAIGLGTAQLTTAAAGADGNFELRGALRGRQLLVAEAEDGTQMARIVDTTAGPLDDVVLVARSGSPLTIETDGELAMPLLYVIADDRGLPLYADLLFEAHPIHFRLAPGNFVVELRDDRGVRSSIPFAMPAKPHTIEVKP